MPVKAASLLLLAALVAMPTDAAPQDPLILQHPSLTHTEFHLFVGQRAASQLESEAFCRQRRLSAVSTREVRYFWKQLPYNISFYLGSRIEMTTDHPEIERGEVLCFPLRRINVAGGPSAAYDALQALHRSSTGGSGSSCRAAVTSVLCKRQPAGWGGNCTATEQQPPAQLIPPQQGHEQKQQQQQQDQGQVTFKSADGSVCLSGPLFWTLAVGTGSLLLLLTAAAATLAACSVRFKRQLNNSFGYQCLSRQASARLMMQSHATKHAGSGAAEAA